jgi:hypothetical protein
MEQSPPHSRNPTGELSIAPKDATSYNDDEEEQQQQQNQMDDDDDSNTNDDDHPNGIKVPYGSTKRRWTVVCLIGMLVGFFFCGSIVWLGISTAQRRQVNRLQSMKDSKKISSNDDIEAMRNLWRTYRNILIQELSPIDPRIDIKLSNPASAEWKALQWLVIYNTLDWTTYISTIVNSTGTSNNGSIATAQHQPLIQRFAIVTIYTHFNVQSWTVSNQHECEWIGVTCTDRSNSSSSSSSSSNDGSLTQIISALNLTINSPISTLSNSSSIETTNSTTITAAMIGTTLPIALAYVSEQLVSLDLSNLSIKGTIPYACYTQWKSLMHLNLDQNQLQRFFTPSPSTLSRRGQIPTSVLSSWWPAIQYINVRNNLLQESILFADENGTETTDTVITGWKDLRYLDVRGNAGLIGPLLEYGLTSWKNIETLELAETSLSGTIPNMNLSLSSLKSLAAWRVPFSGSLPSSLASATNLETLALGLSEVEWTGTLPESYAALTALRTLSLSYLTGITGTLPSSWGNAMTNLETIDLFRNPKLTGPIPSSWGNMSSLAVLRLAETGITGTIPTELGKLTRLIDAALYRTNLMGTMPPEICQLRQAPNVLVKLNVDCAETSPGSNDAPVTCSKPDCCSLCTQLEPF